MNRGSEAVRSGEGFDGGGAFRSFPFFGRPDALQFVLENDAGFSSAQSLVNVLIECVHRGRVRFHTSKSDVIARHRSAGVAAHPTEASRGPRGLRLFCATLDADLVPAALNIFA